MAGIPLIGRRHMNTVSPHKMMLQDHLASGQANICTPIRSRLDSQESRSGVPAFSHLKCDENLVGKDAAS